MAGKFVVSKSMQSAGYGNHRQRSESMMFSRTPLEGAYIIEPERIRDERGFFARVLCENELRRQGLDAKFPQTNMAFSDRKGTLRGLHFQRDPHAEVKLVRCTKGSVYDVIVDLRPQSGTYKRWFGIELSDENRQMLYVPEGFAQGYITLVDNSEIYYHTSEPYCAEAASGVRYDDPNFGIMWPVEVAVISQQDRSWPNYVRSLFDCKHVEKG